MKTFELNSPSLNFMIDARAVTQNEICKLCEERSFPLRSWDDMTAIKLLIKH